VTSRKNDASLPQGDFIAVINRRAGGRRLKRQRNFNSPARFLVSIAPFRVSRRAKLTLGVFIQAEGAIH